MKGRRRKSRANQSGFSYRPDRRSKTFSRERMKRRRKAIAGIAILVALFSLSYLVGLTLFIEDGSAWLDLTKLNIKRKIMLYVPPSPIINDPDKPIDEKPPEVPVVDNDEDTIKPAVVPLKSKPIDFNTLKDQKLLDTFLTDALTEGFDGIVVLYKDIEGTIFGQSENPAVIAAEAMSKDAFDMKQITEAIRQKGLTPVAEISCFKDNLAALHYLPYAIKVSGGEIRWLDKDLKRWLNPAFKESRDYELSVIKDAVSDGFECIYLHNVEFPVQVKSDMIEYPKEHRELDKTEVIDEFIKDAKKIVSEVSENEKRSEYCSLVVQFADKALNDEYYEGKTGHSLTKLLSSADMLALSIGKPEDIEKTLTDFGVDVKNKIAVIVARNADIPAISQHFENIIVK